MIFRFIKSGAHFINHLEFSFRPVYYIFLAALFLFMDCSSRRDRFQPIDYFPIQAGYTWVYNGEIKKMQITDITKKVGDKTVTFSYFDSLDVELWQEKYNLLKGQVYLQSFEPKANVLPAVTFEPALPFAPIGRKAGANDVVESIEAHILDTLVTTVKIDVEYLIEAVEDVQVPAGLFLNCIKMKINVKYPQDAENPYFIGDQYWWFAPRIGPVKYDLPTASGELVVKPDIKAWQPDNPLN